jgi:hypothetical protein
LTSERRILEKMQIRSGRLETSRLQQDHFLSQRSTG